MLLVPDFGDDGSAAIFRIHHCMGDGIGLLPILFSLMDATPEGNGMVFPAVVDRGGKPPNKLAMGLRATLAGPAILGQKFLWRPDRSTLHGQPLSGDKRVGWTDAIDVGLIKEIKNRLGTTVNDVLVACVAGAFQRYAREHPGERLEQLRVSMPVNVRSRADLLKMENKFAAVLLPLPVTEDDPKERIHATKRRMDILKRSSEPIFTYGVVSVLLRTLPPRWSRGIIDYLANKCTCVLSNVPGPREPVYLAGRRLRSMLFWVPQRADIGIGISLLSFAGSLRLGVIADAALVEDPNALARAFEDELHRVRDALDLGAPPSSPESPPAEPSSTEPSSAEPSSAGAAASG
jgi:WS/DGAT/MGAT family acyltransferase